MRRMSGRSPPFLSIGLAFVAIILAYNCWTLNSLNGDLKKETEKLQTEIKLSAVKQVQSEKKVQMLQDNLHEFESKADTFKQQVDVDETKLSDAQNTIKMKEYEITSLKGDLAKLKEVEQDLLQQLEEKDTKIETKQKEAEQILSMKNDVDEVLAEKDALINRLKRQVEQANTLSSEKDAQINTLHSELAKLRKDASVSHRDAAAPPSNSLVSNLPNNQKEEKPHKEKERGPETNDDGKAEDNNVFHYLKPSPKTASKEPLVLGPPPGNGVVEKPNYKLEVQQSKPIPSPNIPDHVDKEQDINPVLHSPGVLNPPELPDTGAANPVLHQPETFENLHRDKHPEAPAEWNDKGNVLPIPLQNPEENPDTAIDEDEKNLEEDPADDQDEEGKEIKRDLENNADENYNNDYEEGDEGIVKRQQQRNSEPRGIGAKMNAPPVDLDNAAEVDRDDVNIEDEKGHDTIYDMNIENRIRNFGKQI